MTLLQLSRVELSRDISPCPGDTAAVLVTISGHHLAAHRPLLRACLLDVLASSLSLSPFTPNESFCLDLALVHHFPCWGAADGPVAVLSSAHRVQTLWDGACW